MEQPVRTVGWDGSEIVVRGVPVYKNPKTGKVRVILHELAKAELRQVAETVGVEPRDIPLLLLFQAPAGPYQKGYLFHMYRLNKMLFYQWKGLEKLGLGEAYPRDEFLPKERGPMPKELKNDLRRLSKLGIVEVAAGEASGKNPKPTQVTLTDKGKAVASEVWLRTPLPYREVSQRVKERLFGMTPTTIQKIVHREFPAYKATYKQLDEE